MNRKMKVFLFLVFLFTINLITAKSGDNWKNWLGPTYNGKIDIDLKIPSDGSEYKTNWQVPVGLGWSSPIVSSGAVFIHDRVGDKENIRCLDAENGEQQWNFSYLSKYRDDFGMEGGPRSTPAVHAGILISHSPQGLVHALDASTGRLIWKIDLVEKFSSPKGFFGRCSSPLIVGGKVFLEVGGENTGVIALNLQTGSLIWKTPNYKTDYASLVPRFNASSVQIVGFSRDGLFVMDSEDGEILFFDSFKSPIGASVHAASPLVFNEFIFLSACYELGAGLWKFPAVLKENNGARIEWKRKGLLDCHYSTPVEKDGFLFGFHGRQERSPVLRCIEIATGEIKWTSPPTGAGNIILANDKIAVLLETGELRIIKASTEAFETLFTQQILGSETRAHFAMVGNRLYARDKRRLIALNLD